LRDWGGGGAKMKNGMIFVAAFYSQFNGAALWM
jgi:hypothetical protein